MTRDEVLDKIKVQFKDKILSFYEHSPKRVYITVAPEDAFDMCKYVFEECGGRLATASGVDTPDGIEILYHFGMDGQGMVLTVKTKIPTRENPKIKSIATFLPGAVWIEREIHEMLGVEFEGHPDMRRLLLPDDWPEGVYPLRRDFKGVEG
ncbi:MAG: hypothetical protein DRP95_00780 [Candidatus Latescibacterota bacterium]|nr:MAG: hypothetical protein DRP95_00780 [Candidatus Latescibacterota bacterium]